MNSFTKISQSSILVITPCGLLSERGWVSTNRLITGVMCDIMVNKLCVLSSNPRWGYLYFILFHGDALKKGMNPFIFAPIMRKQYGRLGSLALVQKLVEENENPKFKPASICLKIDLVSHLAFNERVGKIPTGLSHACTKCSKMVLGS